ncbi:MAG TPA: gluconate 2-dehydrogenase subunit 3 family protein [Candidatus Solibacter sp.]|nr:gluconate 2-dehydrogenase subunit 3 family protein [Candidatus Solibacter sp.]
MQRRDALRLLMTGAVLPALSPEAFAIFREAHPAAGYALKTLDPHQNATVVAMTDLIIPATDTPGAKGALVNEFIDLILTEWAIEEERAHFLEGLADVDKHSNELFGKDFVNASTAQQTALLREMDDATMGEASRNPRDMALPRNFDAQMKGKFWHVFKGITLHGYYTSEIGFSQELKLQIIPGALHGCMPASSGGGEA